MKNAPVRHAVEYAVYRGALGALRALPHRSLPRWGRRLGRLGYRLLRRKRELALRNLEWVFPEKTAEEREDIARASFAQFGSYLLQIPSMTRFDADEILALFDVEGWEHLEGVTAGGKGALLTTGHFGCSEMAMYPLALRMGNFVGIARQMDNPHIDAHVSAVRERFGIEIMHKKGVAHRMLNAYRRGKRLAVMIDQHVHPNLGIQVPFFGRPAWTTPILAMISLRTGAPVVPFCCLPADEPGRYRLVIRPPIEPEGEGPGAVQEMTRRYLSAVEDDILMRPELWMWMHRRWREGARRTGPAADWEVRPVPAEHLRPEARRT